MTATCIMMPTSAFQL